MPSPAEDPLAPKDTEHLELQSVRERTCHLSPSQSRRSSRATTCKERTKERAKERTEGHHRSDRAHRYLRPVPPARGTKATPASRVSSPGARSALQVRSQNKENDSSVDVLGNGDGKRSRKRVFDEKLKEFRETFSAHLQPPDKERLVLPLQKPESLVTRSRAPSNSHSHSGKSFNEQIDNIVARFGTKTPRKPPKGARQSACTAIKNLGKPPQGPHSNGATVPHSSTVTRPANSHRRGARADAGDAEERRPESTPRSANSEASAARLQQCATPPSPSLATHGKQGTSASPTDQQTHRHHSPSHHKASADSPSAIRQRELASKAELREARHRITCLQDEVRNVCEKSNLALRERDLDLERKCAEIAQLQHRMGEMHEELRAKSGEIQFLIEQQNFLVAQQNQQHAHHHQHPSPIHYFDNGREMQQQSPHVSGGSGHGHGGGGELLEVLRARIADLEARIGEKDGVIDALRRAKNGELEGRAGHVEALQAQLESLTKENTRLKVEARDLASETGRLSELNTRYNERLVSHSANERRLKLLETENFALNDAMRRKDATLVSLEQTLREQQKQQEQQQQQREATRTAFEAQRLRRSSQELNLPAAHSISRDDRGAGGASPPTTGCQSTGWSDAGVQTTENGSSESSQPNDLAATRVSHSMADALASITDDLSAVTHMVDSAIAEAPLFDEHGDFRGDDDLPSPTAMATTSKCEPLEDPAAGGGGPLPTGDSDSAAAAFETSLTSVRSRCAALRRQMADEKARKMAESDSCVIM